MKPYIPFAHRWEIDDTATCNSKNRKRMRRYKKKIVRRTSKKLCKQED